MKQTTISIQDLSGAWSQVGTGTMRGIQPSDVELVSDTWGPKDATFTLSRELFVPWPDIQAYAPVEITVGGVIVWRGRIVDAPTNSASRSIAVRCEGKQNHLDDDQYERVYVHTDLTQWQDARSFLGAPLTDLPAGVSVGSDNGLTLTFPKDVNTAANARAAAFLDLGPNSSAERVVVAYAMTPSAPGASWYLLVRGYDDPSTFESGYDAALTLNNPTASGGTAGSFTTPHRYVGIELYNSGAITGLAQDVTARIDSVQVFSSATWESGGVSVLRGDHIVSDALNKATVQLSDDRSLIDSTGSSFYIPEFAPSGPRTARQAIEAANVFYDWRTKVDESDRFVFKDRTGEAPAVRVGRWGSSSFEDASSASGDEIYSRVIVTGQDAAGQPVRSDQHSGTLSGAVSEIDTSIALYNPSFDASASGWAGLNGSNTVARTTTSGEYDTGPAGGKWDSGGSTVPAGNSIYTSQFATGGKFIKGLTYVLTLVLRADTASGRGLILHFGNSASDEGVGYTSQVLGTGFITATVTWTPKATYDAATDVYLEVVVRSTFYRIYSPVACKYFIDSMTVSRAAATLVDKRGFVKTHTLDTSFMLTDASASRLGKIFLEAHRTTPFKGQGQITGHNAARDYTTGMPVAPERLLLMTDRLMHFDDRVNPDTGAVGRDGRIVSVRYTPANDTATFDIDNSRKDFDALLERLGVSIGQIR